MRRLARLISVMIIVLPAFWSCKTFSSFIHDGDVVAKVGNHKLYSSELASCLPKGLTPEDSTDLAHQYIESWASDRLFMDNAEKSLSKQEKNVSEELATYRRSLLRYRYEQKYVNERLDTTVTAEQISKYYDDHLDSFTLEVPIVRARFLSISQQSPYLKDLLKMMKSDNASQEIAADTLALSSALKFTDFDGRWVDMMTLSHEFGTDYVSLLQQMSGNVVDIRNADGTENIAYIEQMMRPGQTGPLEFYKGRIKDIILSARKNALLASLEQELLEKARNQGNFEIY